MAYTDIDKPSDYFETKLYTGNSTGSTQQAITGLDFSPNMVWIKPRSDAEKHSIADTVRGATKTIHPHNTEAEETSAGHMVSFDSNGYTVGVDNYSWNKNGSTYASWNWKAGTSFTNDASATGIGNIDSTGSVNTDAGFSVISYTGDANADNTVAHGLGSVPKMIILKNRSISSNWMVYHASTGAQAPLFLNLGNAAGSGDPDRFKVVPTSSVFTPGTAQEGNGSGNSIIAYCFADVKGYSKVGGSYTGNGNANGSYIHLGFAPAFVLIKNADAGEAWQMFDNKRLSFNQTNGRYSLNPNSNAAEYTGAPLIDFLSNGFKLRTDTNSLNVAQNYIYMAFAENPFVTSTGVPATAR